jgi:signal peptidase I
MSTEFEQKSTQKKERGMFSEMIRFIFIALVIVIPIRAYVAQPFVVQGSSMDPTFKTSDYLIVDQLSYNLREPHRGEVAVIRYPLEERIFFIKRVIGFPGDKIIIDGGEITIINKEHPEGFTLTEPYVEFSKDEHLERTVPEGEYFVMGDNRAGSSDSRMWGTVPKKDMVGRALIRLLPLKKISILPGSYTH